MRAFFANKSNTLFVVLAAIFLTNALVAEFIGVKIFSLEKTLGLTPADINLFGVNNLSFNLTCGVLMWPVVFVLTDIINEYYGMRGVRFLSWIAAVMIAYAFIVFFVGIRLVPADFWPNSHIHADWTPEHKSEMISKVGDYNEAFKLVFGQGLWIIVGSLVAFLIGQIVDVFVFHRIKEITGERKIWLRSTGSTLISQFIDSFVVLFIAFYIGASWSLSLVFAIGIVNYIYKFGMALILTPVIYWVHTMVEKYLGHELATQMKSEAMRPEKKSV
ncbi:MAG: queuosine precursor transporter [Saprospiraceae bacterium]